MRVRNENKQPLIRAFTQCIYLIFDRVIDTYVIVIWSKCATLGVHTIMVYVNLFHSIVRTVKITILLMLIHNYILHAL